jgi:ATP-dependent exoDNAse (exonuclease V) alpha subunit
VREDCMTHCMTFRGGDGDGAVQEISGIGKGRLAKIKTAWLEQQAVREIMVYLHAHGVGSTFAQRIYKKYGERVRLLVATRHIA